MQENALAVHRIHEIKRNQDASWNTSKTGEILNYSQQYVSDLLGVANEIISGNEAVKNATTAGQAISIVRRQTQRTEDNFLNAILEPKSEKNDAPDFSIECADFTKWAAQYEGTKFNLLHCDFPYGINHGKSAQGGTAGGSWDGYADGEDVYWQLLEALAVNIDKLLLPSAHVMFWFSMKFYCKTIAFFESATNLKLVTPLPLIWQKSDGKGMVPDVTREPRRVYETALLLSRGDRRIIKPVHNACYLPSQKADAIHVSEKPEAVLLHFFALFIDEETTLLDPTCGSGSAIRAAKHLKAKRALGLELNSEFATAAQEALQRQHTLSTLLSDIGHGLNGV